MAKHDLRGGTTAWALGVLIACGVTVSSGCGENPLASIPVAAEPAKPPAAESPSRGKKPAPSAAATAAYAAAAEQNAQLSTSMPWSFAGRAQNGWGLYSALVGEMVGTDAAPGSPEFAYSVAEWQRKNGVRPADGVITAAVWTRMTQALQAGRAFDSAQPPAEELVEVPASEWYDAGRAPELRMLRRDAYEAYQKMAAAARADLGPQAKNYFKLVSGYRSPEYQAGLREKAGNPSTATLAIHSPHTTGRAMDVYVGGDPVSTDDANRAIQVATPAYQWLVHNARRFGFLPYFYEPWHWEYKPGLAKA